MARREIAAEVIGNARAMHASGMSKTKIAAHLGLSRDTVKRYVAGESPKSADVEVIEAKTTGTREKIRDNVETFLMKASDVAATDDFVTSLASKPKDMMIGLGIAVEKMELLSGRATTRSESLRIELVAGGSLTELADRVMSGTTKALTPGEAHMSVVEIDKRK